MNSRFFISCALGFESEVSAEIQEIWPYLLNKDASIHAKAAPEIKIFQGGVELECEEILGFQLNFFLKTAHRVLWRLDEFRCRHFNKLELRLKEFPWRSYLPSMNVDLKVSASESKLNNEKRICEVFEKQFSQAVDSSPFKLYVRMHQDVCTISLDTSGDHLHKRSYAIYKGEAPLRETLASFLLRKMIEDVPLQELKQITLIDPMVGSGTFLWEALNLYKGIFGKDYSFMHFSNAPKLLKSPDLKFNYRMEKFEPFAAYFGFDKDPKAIEIAQKNLDLLKEQLPYQAPVHLEIRDLSISQAKKTTTNRKWIIGNPPYGQRLSLVGIKKEELLTRIIESHRPERLGLLQSRGEGDQQAVPRGYRWSRKILTNNGGLPTEFNIWTSVGI